MAESATSRSAMTLWPRRVAELMATFMIGDGLLGALQPRRHVALWEKDALGAEVTVAPFVDHLGRRRVYGAAQIGLGLLIASRLKRQEPQPPSTGN